MVNAPISIPLSISKSRQPSDLIKSQALAAAAVKIERYINSKMDAQYIQEFDFATIAAALAMDLDRVRDLLIQLDGNGEGITICNPQKRPKPPKAPRPGNRGSEPQPSRLDAQPHAVPTPAIAQPNAWALVEGGDQIAPVS
jgi:hypothetical protein